MRNKVVGSFLHSGVNTPPLYPLLFTPSAGNKRLRMFVIIKPLKCRKSILEDALKLSQLKCSIDFRRQFFSTLSAMLWQLTDLLFAVSNGNWAPALAPHSLIRTDVPSTFGKPVREPYLQKTLVAQQSCCDSLRCLCVRVSWSITCWIFKSHQNISAI